MGLRIRQVSQSGELASSLCWDGGHLVANAGIQREVGSPVYVVLNIERINVLTYLALA